MVGEALEVWAGEKGLLGREGVGEGSARQGWGILGFCIVAQEQKVSLVSRILLLQLLPACIN